MNNSTIVEMKVEARAEGLWAADARRKMTELSRADKDQSVYRAAALAELQATDVSSV